MDEKLQGFTEQMEQQAAGIQETTATIEEIQANIKQVAEVSSRNTNSGLELQKLSKEKETLFDNVQDSVLNVNQTAEEIQEMAGVVNDIASQTNLLAMNAAIEAAHAGDAGKGFAVAADEIRQLAESSAGSAKIIQEKIEKLRENSQAARDYGVESFQAYKEILQFIQSVSEAFSGISHGTKELEIGSREMLDSITELRNSAKALREGSQTLSEQSSTIHSEISKVDKIVKVSVAESGELLHEGRSMMFKVSELTGSTRLSLNSALSMLQSMSFFDQFQDQRFIHQYKMLGAIADHFEWLTEHGEDSGTCIERKSMEETSKLMTILEEDTDLSPETKARISKKHQRYHELHQELCQEGIEDRDSKFRALVDVTVSMTEDLLE